MDELLIQIKDICDPIIKDFEVNLTSLTDYTHLILHNIYDKTFCKKHIYKEIIRQCICSLYKKKFLNNYNNFHVFDNTHIVDYLKTIPQFEQRTPEWFKMKEDSIGASESAIIFGKSIFSNKNKLLMKKSGYKEEWQSNPACTHGTKYEEAVQMLYQMKHNVKLYEFGSLVHDKYRMISASPDGITERGVMIEIKVPFKRKISGIPPIYYWYQMQQQMEVCNLDRVDFVECNISEYFNKKQFLNDINSSRGPDSFYNANDNVKNIVIEYYIKNKAGRMALDWIYPDKFLKISQIDDWITKCKKNINARSDAVYSKELYYKINIYSCCEVWRDNNWWENNYTKYLDFWKEVEHYRKVGYESLIPKKRPRKPRAKKCLIIDDDE